MARRSKRRGRRSKKFPLLTAAALAVPVIAAVREHQAGGDGIAEYIGAYTGLNVSFRPPAFEPNRLLVGLGPLAAVMAAKFVTRAAGIRIPAAIPVSLS